MELSCAWPLFIYDYIYLFINAVCTYGDSSKTLAIFHWGFKTIFIRLRAKVKPRVFACLLNLQLFFAFVLSALLTERHKNGHKNRWQ